MTLIRYSLAAGILALLTMTLTGSEIELYTESNAAESSSSLSVTCVSPGVVAFSPNVAYSISVPAASTSSFNAGNMIATATLTNAVNSDGNPSVSVGTDAGDSAITLYHNAPYIKVGGVQCSTSSSAKLEAYGDGTDNPNYDVTLQDTSSTTYQTNGQVDNKSSGAPMVVFGGSGYLSGANLSDGSDADTYTNGEITFGGGSAGGFRLFNRVEIIEVNPDGSGETLTWVFTPN